MSIISKNLQVINLERRKQSWENPVSETLLSRIDETATPQGFGTRYNYQLVVKIGVEFWANDAQLKEATRNAATILSRRLYGEALSLVDELVFAVRNHDEETALIVCEEMRKVLT